MKKYLHVSIIVFSMLQAVSLQADRRTFVIQERYRPKRLVVIEKRKNCSNFSDGFFSGMLFERFMQSHPLVTLTAITAFAAACVYACLPSAPKTPVEHTVVYIEDDSDEDEIVYIVQR